MSDVRLSIVGHDYIVTCKDGEEARLLALGSLVDAKAREAGGAAGGLNESRQLLFASLLLADELYDAKAKAPASADTIRSSSAMDEQLAETIERLATRLEQFVEGLEEKA